MHPTDRHPSFARTGDTGQTGSLTELCGLFSLPGLRPGDSIEWLVERLLTDRRDTG